MANEKIGKIDARGVACLILLGGQGELGAFFRDANISAKEGGEFIQTIVNEGFEALSSRYKSQLYRWCNEALPEAGAKAISRRNFFRKAIGVGTGLNVFHLANDVHTGDKIDAIESSALIALGSYILLKSDEAKKGKYSPSNTEETTSEAQTKNISRRSFMQRLGHGIPVAGLGTALLIEDGIKRKDDKLTLGYDALVIAAGTKIFALEALIPKCEAVFKQKLAAWLSKEGRIDLLPVEKGRGI